MADWMSKLSPELTTAHLWNLAIPGSHDSMTYCLDTSSPPTWLGNLEKPLENIFPGISKLINNTINLWAKTQDLNIIQQLDAGIRYFDMRLACMEKNGKRTLVFSHLLYTTVTVEETFNEVVKWLAAHPKEVILISCRSFDGMNILDHRNLIAQLLDIFSNRLCPKDKPITLQDCWDNKQQVILSYADQTQTANQELLWPEIDYWWKKTDLTARNVIDYLSNRLKTTGRDGGKFFVAGLNLTENAEYVVEHLFSSLKQMTADGYPQLMQWVTKQQCGAGSTCINIIAADFVNDLDPDFIQNVISINYKTK